MKVIIQGLAPARRRKFVPLIEHTIVRQGNLIGEEMGEFLIRKELETAPRKTVLKWHKQKTGTRVLKVLCHPTPVSTERDLVGCSRLYYGNIAGCNR